MGANIPDDSDDTDAFFRELRKLVNDALEDGGPPVDRELIEEHLVGALETESDRVVVSFITRFRLWNAAHTDMVATRPAEDGPPVDEGLAMLFATGGLTNKEEIQIRRNCRRYRNWFDQISDACAKVDDIGKKPPPS